MADSSTTPPDDRPGPSGEETLPVEARKDTLAASDGSDFRHGRFEPGHGFWTSLAGRPLFKASLAA